jgi:hypothetical protein
MPYSTAILLWLRGMAYLESIPFVKCGNIAQRCVVDEPGKVRVLEIDPDRKNVAASGKAARKFGP